MHVEGFVMKKAILTILTVTIIAVQALGVGSIEAKAQDKCAHSGCTAYKTTNGTVYCNKHAAEYAKKKEIKVCAAYGCYDTAVGSWCYYHTCREKNCTNKVAEDSKYCYTHSPKKATSSTGTSKIEVFSNKHYNTKSSASKTTTSKYTSKNTQTKSSSSKKSSKKTKDYYDVYNYRSAQDFADDKYEEFFDYEDDYEDEDEAYDAAVDYWNDKHGK